MCRLCRQQLPQSHRLESVEARDDLVVRLDEQFDRELFEEASFRVRLRVEPHTWEAFRLAAIEGLAGAEVSERLGMKVATVFKAKSKVQRMLREEICRLEGVDPSGGPLGDWNRRAFAEAVSLLSCSS